MQDKIQDEEGQCKYKLNAKHAKWVNKQSYKV